MTSARRVPPDRWRPERIAKMNDAFDLLADRPDGITSEELVDWLEVSKSTARRVIHDLRIILGGSDTLTVSCVAEGAPNEPHTYKLVGNYEEARGWITSRLSELEVRIETMEYSAQALATGADGRTVEGKKARKIHRTLHYLREELAEVE